MSPGSFLAVEGIIPHLRVNSKKQVLQSLARTAGEITGFDGKAIFQALADRERLGPTGFGGGVALPHAKLAGLEELCGVFARLAEPVPFDAVDGRPVDLVFCLLAPDREGTTHLAALAGISRLLRDGAMREKLRGASDGPSLHALLAEATEKAG